MRLRLGAILLFAVLSISLSAKAAPPIDYTPLSDLQTDITALTSPLAQAPTNFLILKYLNYITQAQPTITPVRASNVDGYSGTTAVSATTNITFSPAVKTVSFWHTGDAILQVNYTITGGLGNKRAFVPFAGGSGASQTIGISNNLISAISFTNNGSTSLTYIANGVDGGKE